MPPLVHLLAAAPFLVNVLNAMVAGAIAALLVVGASGPPAISVGAGTAVGGIVVAAQLRFAGAWMRRGRASVTPVYPSQAPGERDAAAAERPA